MTTSGETRAQKDARVDGTLQEHHRLLSELAEQVMAANVRTQTSFDELKMMYAHNQSSLEDLKLSMASFAANKQEPAKNLESAGILGSGIGPTRSGLTSNPQPTVGTATVNETRDLKHMYRVGRIDFPRFSGNDVSSWLFQVEHYFEIDGTP